jgi:hypothetical protein
MIRWIVLSLTLFLFACGGNINSANNTSSSNVDETLDMNESGADMADANYATSDINAYANGDGNYSWAAEAAANEIAEAENVSGSVEPSDPQIAQLCRSAEIADTACLSLGNQFRNLEAGVGALNAPAEMSVDGNYTVALAIGRDEDEAEVKETAEGEAGPSATSTVGEVRLARRMRVTLSGSAFRISAEGEPERELGLSRQATWRWQVTPTAEGPQSLVATVEPIAVLADGRRMELGPARRRLDVRVSVTAEQQMGRWERFLKSTTGVLVALAALIAAAGLIVWRVRTFGKKPD